MSPPTGWGRCAPARARGDRGRPVRRTLDARGRPTSGGALPFPHREVRPRALLGLAASGRHRAVVCPTGGSPGAAGPLGGRAARRRAGDPVGVPVGASPDARPRPQLPPFAPPLPERRRGRHLRPPRQRLRAGEGRPQRPCRCAVGGQRLLARGRRRSSRLSGMARRGGHEVPLRRACRSREGPRGPDGGVAHLRAGTCGGGPGARRGGAGRTGAGARGPAARDPSLRPSCEASTRARRCSSSPPCPRGPSASRGAWS